MASRMIHLAAGYCLAESIDPAQLQRFLLGSVMPDALPKTVSHRFRYFDGGRCKTYDLAGFRDRYRDRLGDGLYLGYYMHLVEDIVFRDHLYHRVGYVPTEEKLVQLHRDYTLLNPYLRERYGITEIPALPDDIADEPLVMGDIGAVGRFLEDMRRELTDDPQGEPVCYTKETAEQYIELAVGVCRNELAAFAGRGEHTDEHSFSWLRHN